MQGGTAFDQLLDEHLEELEIGRPTSAHGIPRSTAASYGFFFLDSASHSIAVTASPAVAACPRSASPSVSRARVERWTLPPSASHAVASTRCAGRSRRQQAAIDELLALGARIEDGYSLDELRSAFRTLARRYHPDSHAQASPAHIVQLSAQFARLCEAYRVLASRS